MAVAAARGRDEFVEALVQAGASPDKQVIINSGQGDDVDHNMFTNMCNVLQTLEPEAGNCRFHRLAMCVSMV